MAGSWQVHLGHRLRHRPGIHPLLPVGVVAVGDLQRDRPSEGASVAHARGHLRTVALDLHPAAAAMSELAARHVEIELLLGELDARGQTLDQACEAGAVRLAGCDETELHGP